MRRSFVPVVLAMMFSASIAQAQGTTAAPPAQQPAAAAPQAAPDPLKFTTDDVVIIIQVTGSKAADFEAGFKTMMGKLSSSAKPEVKALGASMSLSKATVPGDNALYVLSIHGASKDLSYNWGKIIYYSGKEPGAAYDGIFEKQEDATPVYKQINDSIIVAGGAQQVSVLPLTKIGG
jgi:hypothetical protein